MKGGALDCVVKPLDVGQLVSLVERAVGAYREVAEVLPFTTAAGADVPGIV